MDDSKDHKAHTVCKPYAQVYSTQPQMISPGGTVSFETCGAIWGFETNYTNVIKAVEGGIYLFSYSVLTLFSQARAASIAYGIEIDGVIQRQSLSGEGSSFIPIVTNVLSTSSGIVRLPPRAKIRLVNAGSSSTFISNNLISTTANTASLTLEKISN